MLEFFGLESWSTALLALTAGTAIGFVVGLVPGIGGRTGLILCLPLATFFPPYEAAIFLFSMHAVVNTSGSIPNIAFGIPSSAADMATIIDGYPLAKMGRAGEALGASLSASAIGGVLGALAFLLAIPIAQPLVTSFGPPEFLMLAILGIAMVSSLSQEGLIPGLIVGALGVVASTVGVDFRSGEARFTFGWLELWDGVGLPAIVCGLFVIPEMLALKPFDTDSQKRATTTSIADVARGMLVTFNHLRVVAVSSWYGIVIGFMPSLGSSISAWLSYGYAARTTRTEIPFGQGAIAGVIAPEAANNSKEGGAMIPTLFFGIPGSSSMAIMMGLLAFVGVAVGPNLLDWNRDLGLSFSLAGAVILSNLVVIPMFLLVIPTLVRFSSIRREGIVPFAIALSIMAALIDTPRIITVVLIAIFAVIGIGMKLANWPRAPFILGYVIGDMAEASWFHTQQIYGWKVLQRPLTIGIALFIVGWLIYVVRSRPVLHIPGPRIPTLATSGGLLVGFGVVILTAFRSINLAGRTFPVAVSIFGAALCALIAWLAFRSKDDPPVEELAHVWIAAIAILAIPYFGLTVSSMAMAVAMLIAGGANIYKSILAALAFGALQFTLLAWLFDIVVEREIIGRFAWRFLGF
ncbi:MAG: tripartite tricarboxylate transporter permease [Bauldia sp.]|nr:tripartite tricarboxylate transporter permease [Bauldia sp.]